MRLLAALALCALVLAERPKLKDNAGHLLVSMTDIPIGSCGDDSYFGLGIMDGFLEKCDRWKLTDPKDNGEYEQYKCKHLRVHAKVENGKCVCEKNWKGPICNEYHGCDDGLTIHKGGCAKPCFNGGTLAVGHSEVECTCPVPWDGRWCERLACWRKTPFGAEKRFKNNVDTCVCGLHYEGENCDIIKNCLNNATLVGNKCECPDFYHGELCDKRCPKGQKTCSASSVFAMVSTLVTLLFALRH